MTTICPFTRRFAIFGGIIIAWAVGGIMGFRFSDAVTATPPAAVHPFNDERVQAAAEARLACLAAYFDMPSPEIVLASDITGWMEPLGNELLGVWSPESHTIIASMEHGEAQLSATLAHEFAHIIDGRGDDELAMARVHGHATDHDEVFLALNGVTLGLSVKCRAQGENPDAPVGHVPKWSGQVTHGDYGSETLLDESGWNAIALTL